MDRAYAAGATGSPPTAPASPSIGYPTAGNPATATPATKPGAYWYHAVTEELMGVIVAAGITPAQGTLTQLKQALDAMYSGASIAGNFSNLKASATGTSAAITVTADSIVVASAAPAFKLLQAVSLSISGAANGANGLDTGALTINTWYSLWVIWNGTTTAGLMSLSATAPTLPGGYTHKARVGWVRTDASGNKYPLGFRQFGRKVNYAVAAGSNLAALPIMAGGVAGSVSTPTWVAVATGAYVPPTASHISANATISAGHVTLVAPNNSYGGSTSTTNQPPLNLNIAGYGTQNCVMPLESTNIYWTSDWATAQLTCFGWEDNL